MLDLSGATQFVRVIASEPLQSSRLRREVGACIIERLEELLLAGDHVPTYARLEVDDYFLDRAGGDELVAGVMAQPRGLARLGDRQQQERKGRADHGHEYGIGHDHADRQPAPHSLWPPRRG
ncbi:MAG TPA: hypothetical protein VGQ92_20135 [Actinoplanes sp.]|jgi:hypothetical protein|nr:hypothetical protein [Actinoplanes sp.]